MPSTRSTRRMKTRRSPSCLSTDKTRKIRIYEKSCILFSWQGRTDTIFSSPSAGLDFNTNSWLSWLWILFSHPLKKWFCQDCQPDSLPLNTLRRARPSLWVLVKCLQELQKPKQILDFKETSRSCWQPLLASSSSRRALLLTNTLKTTTWNALQTQIIFRENYRMKDSVWTPFQTRANTWQVLRNTSQLSLELICQTSLVQLTRTPICLIHKLSHPNNKFSV